MLAKASATRPLHHIAPDGVTTARLLPSCPKQFNQLRSSLSGVQQQLDTLLASGSSRDRVEGGLAAAALCIVVHRSWSEAAAADHVQGQQQTATQTPAAANNKDRAARFVAKATEQASQLLLAAANGTNSRPDIDWEAFPPAIRQQLLALFQQQGFVSTLGFAVHSQQLPYERPMGLDQYHSFIISNPFYMAHFEESYWIDTITPTPAYFPWIHPRQLQQSLLTEDNVLSLCAHLPIFRPVLEAAVAAKLLPQHLLLQAQQAAASTPPSTMQLFLHNWIQQAGAAVSATAASILSGRRTARAVVKRSARRPGSGGSTSSLTRGISLGVCANTSSHGVEETRGDGRGGWSFGAVTAVGSGDEGDRAAAAVSVSVVGDAQQQSADLLGAEGNTETDVTVAGLHPTDALLRGTGRSNSSNSKSA